MSTTGDEAEEQVPEQTQDAPSGSEYEEEAERQEEDYDEESESEREGRFHGPDSSWRFYTKEERAIVSALDQAENNDLSAHLYNAHAWKQRLRDVERMRESLPWHTKNGWVQPEDNGKLPFLPPAAWTAWPLRPEDVPRSREQWGIPAIDPEEQSGTFTKVEPWRPSLNLHEEVKAVFLRTAKEAFRERERAVNVKKEGPPQKASEIPISSEATPTRSGSEQSEDDDESDEDQKSSQNGKKEEDEEEDVDMESVIDHKLVGEEYVSSFLLDDDIASSILEPTVNHVIAKFDDLLIGLHKSRLGHRQDRSRSRGSSANSRFRSKSRERPRSAASVPSKRKRAVSDNNFNDDNPTSEDVESDTEIRTGRKSQRESRRRMPAPRDWSEVLGIAAMVGWDQDVLDRAERRCAATFGEGMTMRIMPETSFGTSRDQIVEYVPDMIPPIDDWSENDIDSEEESEEPPSLACPEEFCPRHSEPYESAWRLREHLKKKHKLSKDEVNRLVPRVSAPTSQTRAKDRGEASGGEDEIIDDDTVAVEGGQETGAVRLDGFLQPINIRLHRSKDKQPRKRSASRRRVEDTSAE
ncbi:hypothetical protein M409DRAFT_70438 [Zasmidium cellare ATCC 36951]|uniref:Rrn9 domain-containing protein n=1 Tax=Zasmidium cellare ATCC 36951 TaxID=1080233 RepID=A0A6A6C3L7_ZASCE|nr:uncharacterized protein M409DRAFT_70438 [Zasmidium cellare ATCC 36951]KAF2160472.1 hypothetical protein M409DRAFT_70438 [Zasmidium cellare ATCC 36951]